jgi:predicted DNA-binding transcriptional regulator AlpA
MKTVDAGNVLVFLDVTQTERKRLLAAADNEPVKKKQKLLTVKQVAEILGVHPGSIKRYVKIGLLHPIRITSRMVRYEEEDVLALLQSRE